MGFFDLSRRHEGLDRKNDPLATLAVLVPWETFRPLLHAALSAHGLRTPAAQRKGAAGRKPWDEVVILKALVVQALYNLSDGQMEFQRRDRLSFMRFLGPGIEDRVPDATTLWLYREALAKAGMVERLCDAFDAHLRAQGCLAMGGQIIDASIVAAPKRRQHRRRAEATPASSPRRSDASIVAAPKRRQHRRRAEAAQRSRGERAGQGRRDTTELRRQPGHGPAKGQGRALDQEARAQPPRLPEPRQHRPAAQAGAAPHGHRRGPARQPGTRGAAGPGQHGLRRVGGQRLPLCGHREEPR
jgi:Transposase domain (DUF772)